MGMAASQARYLSLVARQSNVEYQGQQINQARTALSNQSANLFNQMLGLTVPVPPSTQDYTKTQYSYTDGTNSSVITSWQQLGTSDPNYNYVVTHSYTTNKFTGSLKKLSNPQVQYTVSTDRVTDSQIKLKRAAVYDAEVDYNNAVKATEDAKAALKELTNYADTTTITVTSCTEGTDGIYTVNGNAYTPYAGLTDAQKTEVDTAIKPMKENGVNIAYDTTQIYYDTANKKIAFKDDLDNAKSATTSATVNLSTYSEARIDSQSTTLKQAVTNAEANQSTKKAAYDIAVADYEALNHPNYVGNCELTPLATLTKDQQADIEQIIKDMEEQGIECNIRDCCDSAGNYIGGIYSYQMNGQTYYTTLADLNSSYESTIDSDKPLEDQTKLTYYNAAYINTTVEKTEKALLETDGSGRFTSVKFEDDSVKYTLNMETITDDNAYQDAMNEYYYENALYDKTIQDINAKTSLIQQEDQQLELKLKQLDTERQALKNEIDAVKTVVKDAVESGFKTFGG